LIALLLIDATIAVPQEARAELKSKSSGIAPAGASPVQTKLYQYKRYSNNMNYGDNNNRYHMRHHKNMKNSYRYRDNGDNGDHYLLAERDDGDKQLWRQNCYEPSYCESNYVEPSYCESNNYGYQDLLEDKKPDGAKQLWKQNNNYSNCKSAYKAPSYCSSSYMEPSSSCSNDYNKYLLANRAKAKVQNQDPDWGQTDPVLVQYYNDNDGGYHYNDNDGGYHYNDNNYHYNNRYHNKNHKNNYHNSRYHNY